jgi:hypothetical protein
MLEERGGESPMTAEERAIYRRESEAITGEGPGVLRLERMLALSQAIHDALVARLEVMDEGEMAREIDFRGRKTTIGWRVLFLNFHFTYHVGQLELLRQLAGRTEKVI